MNGGREGGWQIKYLTAAGKQHTLQIDRYPVYIKKKKTKNKKKTTAKSQPL